MKYIDADLIEQHVHILHDEAKENLTKMDAEEYRQYWIGRQGAYSNVLTAIRAFRKQNSTLDSLQQEQQEVDLKKEIQEYIQKLGFGYGGWVDGLSDEDLKNIARYFYELGLKSK